MHNSKERESFSDEKLKKAVCRIYWGSDSKISKKSKITKENYQCALYVQYPQQVKGAVANAMPFSIYLTVRSLKLFIGQFLWIKRWVHSLMWCQVIGGVVSCCISFRFLSTNSVLALVQFNTYAGRHCTYKCSVLTFWRMPLIAFVSNFNLGYHTVWLDSTLLC